jgi:hypothetical protein
VSQELDWYEAYWERRKAHQRKMDTLHRVQLYLVLGIIMIHTIRDIFFLFPR